MVLRMQVLSDRQLSFNEMGVFGKCGFGNEYVYDHGFGLTRYIAREYGDEMLAELYRGAARWRTLDINGLIAEKLGRSVEQLHADWVTDMRVSMRRRLRRWARCARGSWSPIRVSLICAHGSRMTGMRLAYLSTQKQHYGPHLLVMCATSRVVMKRL